MITLGLFLLERNNKDKELRFYALAIAADCYIVEKIVSILR